MTTDKGILSNPTLLTPGSGITYHQFEKPSYKILQTFHAPSSTSVINFVTHEVTALCPLTEQPDFYTVSITYTPDKLCVESKSAKLYLGAYRQQTGFIENLTLRILQDWVKACSPSFAGVTLTMAPRGGIAITVTEEYRK